MIVAMASKTVVAVSDAASSAWMYGFLWSGRFGGVWVCCGVGGAGVVVAVFGGGVAGSGD